jgi:hypothetical protein
MIKEFNIGRLNIMFYAGGAYNDFDLGINSRFRKYLDLSDRLYITDMFFNLYLGYWAVTINFEYEGKELDDSKKS